MDHKVFLYNSHPTPTLDMQHVKRKAYSHATKRQAGLLTDTLISAANFQGKLCFVILRNFSFCMKLNDSLPPLLEWRKLHNVELSDLYSLPNIVRVVKSKRMRWAAGHVVRMGEGRGVYRVLVGKPEGKRTLERPRHRWENNNKMDLQEVGGSCGDWMELA